MQYSLVTFDSGLGSRAGLLVSDRVHDLADRSGNPSWRTVFAVLQGWPTSEPILQALADDPKAPGLPLDRVRLLAPLPDPGAIYCAGANYTDHVAEMAAAKGLPLGPNMKEAGDRPWHFLKSARASIVGPESTVKTPAPSDLLDWEIELAVVIGKATRQVSAADAMSAVAGYTVANDLSIRNLMCRPRQDPSSPFYYDWIGQKCFDGACPIGPCIVPASQVPDPHRLAMKLWVGDELMQDSNTSNLIFDIAEQIEALSARVTLYPGDLILTGTPAGVGMPRNRFLQRGERVRLWIERIGELKHEVG